MSETTLYKPKHKKPNFGYTPEKDRPSDAQRVIVCVGTHCRGAELPVFHRG